MRRVVFALCVIVPLLVPLDSVSQVEQEAAAESSEEDSPGEPDGSLYRWDFVPDVSFSGAIGPDSNVLRHPDGSDTVLVFRGAFIADGRFRRLLLPAKEAHYPRFLELSVGLSGFGALYDGYHDAEPRGLGAHAALDFDLLAARSSNALLKKLTFGLAAQVYSRGRDSGVEADGFGIVPAVMLTFAAEGECELDSLVLYYRYEDSDEQGPEERAPTRDLLRRGFGFDYTFSVGEPRRNQLCERLGPFRRAFRPDVPTFYVTGESREDSIEGVAAEAEVGTLELGGEVPLRWEKKRTRFSIDGLLGFSRFELEDPGFSGLERQDDRWLADLGLRYCLASCGTGDDSGDSGLDSPDHLDLRIGLTYTHRDSSVPGFDFDRVAVTFGVTGRFGGWAAAGPIVGTAGVRLGPRTGDSGTTDPEIDPGGGG